MSGYKHNVFNPSQVRHHQRKSSQKINAAGRERDIATNPIKR